MDIDEELEDDALLGEATLAKMSAARDDVPEGSAAEKTETQGPAAKEDNAAAETGTEEK